MSKELITSLIVAAPAWIIAIIALAIGYYERKEGREREEFIKTLDYFEGGSQRRSVGIALVEGVWLRNPKYEKILVPMIANQIVYLLLVTRSRAPHNERNLIRLLKIFSEIPNVKTRYYDTWCDVAEALNAKFNGENKGIQIGDATLRA